MSLNHNDQLQLLVDILDDHQSEKDGEIAEYQQVKRIIKSLLANQTVTNEQLEELLPQIYNYCLQGENVQNQEEHIESNKDNIQGWMDAIEQTATASQRLD
ncbi:YtzH-like family protein [Virgibacillus soli]|uniref:YtzH-like family protein n=1 Tax=Paracerasibacillus soli TaxID=480284 RepID=A0ABU5CS74_9BACI|nr:YtzH-like family protein [Virgibacillus soli]MDY0408731.1 YtzH-like family protein [Virgibacillus soli]